MSSLYVRDTLRAWMAGPGMTLPFFDTINIEQAQQRDAQTPWSTLVFVSALTQRMTYCRTFEESGSFDYVALGPPGVGDHDLIAAAEADVALLLQQVDPLGRLTLLRASPPEDFLQGGSTPYYTVSMVIDYLYEQPPQGQQP